MTRNQWLGFAALLLCHTLVSLHGIGELYLAGHVGWAGALRSTIARNYLELGLFETGLLPYKQYFTTANLAKDGIVHWNHPPTVNLLVALSFAAFGISEWAANLVAVVFRIALMVGIFAYAKPRYGYAVAWAAGLVFACLPLQLEYGKLINYEMPLMVCILGALVVLERRQRLAVSSTGPLTIPAIAALACLAGLFDWTGFILAGALGVYALAHPTRDWRTFLAIGISTSIVLAGLFWWLNTAADGGLVGLGKHRAGGTYSALIRSTGFRFWTYAGPVVLLGMVAGIFQSIRHRSVDGVLVVFGGGGALYFLVFKQAAQVHVFYILIFIVPLVLLAARGFCGVSEFIALKVGKGAAIGFLAVILLGQAGWLYSTYPQLHSRTYGVKTAKKHLEKSGRLSTSIMGKWLNQNSQPDDVIAFHRSISTTVPMKWYVWRRSKLGVRVPPKQARYLVAGERMPKQLQRQLAKKHKVTRMMGYLVFDLQSTEAGVTAHRLVAKDPGFWHTYLVSSFYPPYELVPDPKSAAAYAKKVGVRP